MEPPKPESRAYTPEELRAKFLKHMFSLCRYWASHGPENVEEKLEGICHSILAYIDGRTLNSPAIDLVACPHETDKEYSISQGENWVEPKTLINDCSLTEEFFTHKPK